MGIVYITHFSILQHFKKNMIETMSLWNKTKDNYYILFWHDEQVCYTLCAGHVYLSIYRQGPEPHQHLAWENIEGRKEPSFICCKEIANLFFSERSGNWVELFRMRFFWCISELLWRGWSLPVSMAGPPVCSAGKKKKIKKRFQSEDSFLHSTYSSRSTGPRKYQ